MSEVKITSREMMATAERAVERLPHSAKYARQSELDRDALNLRAIINFLRWADDNRKAIAAALASEKEVKS